MNSIELMDYWIKSSDRDYESMKKNFEVEQYTWALFIGPLTIEKLLKAIYAKVNKDVGKLLHDFLMSLFLYKKYVQFYYTYE